MLSLTPKDFDFEKRTVSINRTFAVVGKEHVFQPPKTPKSKRVITLPEQLCELLQNYISMQYKLKNNDRVFDITKSTLQVYHKKAVKLSDSKYIRIHDLRHVYVKL